MIKNYDYYRKLITSEYRYAPKYNKIVKALVNYGLGIDAAVDKMLTAFEIDNAGTDQLDILGAIVGVSRTLDFAPSALATGEIVCPAPEQFDIGLEYEKIITPVPSKMAETSFISDYAPEYMNDDDYLDDDIYRVLIKARIVKNAWKGTITELYDLWDMVFGKDKHLAIQDLQDMSYNMVLQGSYTLLEQELITHGYIVPKPEGVRINVLTFVSTDGLPIFSYDYNTMTYSGYGSHWVEN